MLMASRQALSILINLLVPVASYSHLWFFTASPFMQESSSACHMTLGTDVHALTQPLMCVISSGSSFLCSSFVVLREKKAWGPLGLLLCSWMLHEGLRIAKLHYVTIIPSSVFSFLTWALKNFCGSKSPRVHVPSVHISSGRHSFRAPNVVPCAVWVQRKLTLPFLL